MSPLLFQKKAKSLVAYYTTLIPDDKAVFLKTLASQYSVDHSVVLHLAKSLESAHVRDLKKIKFPLIVHQREIIELRDSSYR